MIRLFLFTIILSTLNACAMERPSFDIHPLPPVRYEFRDSGNRLNDIRYFYLDGDFCYNKPAYDALKEAIEQSGKTDTATYLSSVYVYRKTEALNESYNQGRAGLDGHNEDLIAYIRYQDQQPDIFYIIRNGVVIFDNIGQEEMNMEFDQ